MKKLSYFFSFILLLLAIYYGFKSEMPVYSPDIEKGKTEFSTDRALLHVKKMSTKPHGVGSAAHTEVRNYIVDELQKLGLKTSLQTGNAATSWNNLSKATNILARIKGSENGKALVLLSHYDSSPHSSLGASDAASGVATILEGVRAFLAKNKTPKNDIIILITDGEELGLNGASVFVNQHPWSTDVGFVLNFEARGSGGPSYMLVETNQSNGNLIAAFKKANTQFPVANSLVYSVYKMMPNDTDLTVFREDADIDGFNFAFVDDHFDYHTANDTFERLDKKTLAHQGSYLMPLVQYFANTDLSQLKSSTDFVYFNMPVFKLVSYPFAWIWPMLIIAALIFIVLLIFGFKKNLLQVPEIAKGFVPMLLAVLLNGVIGYFAWPVLKWMYPHYKDMLHGFTYNGYTYIAAFVFIAVAICFYSYKKFAKVTTVNLLVAPIFLWLLLNALIVTYLPGASYFIIPVFGLLISFFVLLNQEKPNPFLLLFLGLPAVWLLSPLIKMFPVGLGLKMMILASLLTTFLFLLLFPLLGQYKRKGSLALFNLIGFIFCLFSAHFNADFTNENGKPTSLVYMLNANTNTAQWATYENVLSDWTAQYINQKSEHKSILNTIKSKYSSGFTYTTEAPLKNIKTPIIETVYDTIINNERTIDLCIQWQRSVDRIEFFTNPIKFSNVEVNGISLNKKYIAKHTKGRLFTQYITNEDYAEIKLTFKKDAPLVLTMYEASNDLLSNDQFTVPKRPENTIPMPFVLNDAIIVAKTIRFD